MKISMKQIVLATAVLTAGAFAQAEIRIDGAYQGVLQSKGYGKATCSVNLQKAATSYVLNVTICPESSKSCNKTAFTANSAQSVLNKNKVERALDKAQLSRGKEAQIFKVEGNNNGFDEALVGRLNSEGELVQLMYTTGGWLYPVYFVCGNLSRN